MKANARKTWLALGIGDGSALRGAWVAFSADGDDGRTRQRMSVDTIEDFAVFSSLSLAVIVLIY